MLSKIFRFGPKKPSKKVHISDSDDDQWLENFHLSERALPNVNRSQIRVLVFKDHDKKGDKCVLFDSKTAVRDETQQNSENGRPFRRRLSSDVHLLGEMIFGSVEMTYKGPTVKVHSIRTPPQLLLTKVFALKPMRASHSSSTTAQSMSDYLQSSSRFTGSVSESVSSVQSLNVSSDTEESSLAKSVPVFTHSQSLGSTVQLQNVVGSLSNSLSANIHSLNATFPRTSENYQRRFLRSQVTRMDYGCLRRNESFNEEMSMRLRRRPKIGIGVLFSLWEDKDMSEENNKLFQSFCFSHFPLIESHIHQLRRRVENTLLSSLQMSGESFQDALVDVTNKFADGILKLYYAPRIRNPVWLTMLSQPDQCDSICEDLVPQLVNAIQLYNTKEKHFFLATLLTAVLRYHVAWVTTVTPSPVQARRACLDKHSSETLDVLGESHPYNPLWAQLSDLYGAGGDPTRMARTVVVGKDKNLVTMLLHILSYFIRCSEVFEQPVEETPTFSSSCSDSLSLSTSLDLTIRNEDTDTGPSQEDSEKEFQSSGKVPRILENASQNLQKDAAGVSRNRSNVCENCLRVSEKDAQVSEDGSHVSKNCSGVSENAWRVSENDARDSENGSQVSQNCSRVSENRAKVFEDDSQVLESGLKFLENCVRVSKTNSQVSEDSSRASENFSKNARSNLESNCNGKTSGNYFEKTLCEQCNKLSVTIKERPLSDCLLDRTVEACSCSGGVFTGNSKENRLWKSFLRTSCCEKACRNVDSSCLSKKKHAQEIRTKSSRSVTSFMRAFGSNKKPEKDNHKNETFCIQNRGKTISLDRQSIVNMFLSSFPLCPICQGRLSFIERDVFCVKDGVGCFPLESGLCGECDKLKACSCQMMDTELDEDNRCDSSITVNSDYSSGISVQSFEAEVGSLSGVSVDSGLNIHCIQSTDGNVEDSCSSVDQLCRLELPESDASVENKEVTSSNSQDCQLFSFGRSLMAGYCDEYLPDFVLHGTDVCKEEQPKYDLKVSLEQPVVDNPVSESVVIVGDTNNWECSVRSHRRPKKGVGNYPSYLSKKGECSSLVNDFLTSFCNLWEMNMSAQFCLMHLEDKMKEIYLRSKVISEYLLTQRKYITRRDLMLTFGYNECDLALLMSVIGVHSPPAVARIPQV